MRSDLTAIAERAIESYLKKRLGGVNLLEGGGIFFVKILFCLIFFFCIFAFCLGLGLV